MPHIHDIVDAGNHFVIDPLLRTISTTTPELVLAQGDHNSERYTFEIPRTIEGHDMSLCNRIEVHYDNISKDKKETSEGFYVVVDAATTDDILIFSWIISGNATRLAGTMKFWVTFRCVNDNGDIVYSWGTDVFKSVKVIANNCNTRQVIETFPDVLEQWKQDVIEDIGAGISPEDISKAVSDYLQEHPVEGGVNFTTDATLVMNDDGVLSVNTTNDMEQDNTLPITSAGVYATVGNIEALLKTI